MTLPNKITTIRIILLPFFIISVVKFSSDKNLYRYLALGIFCLAGFSDFLDGYLARRLNQETEVGRILDVVADKILLISSFITLSLLDNFMLPFWVTFIVIIRDIAVIAGVIFIYLKYNKLYIFPSILGKISITWEMLTIISVLLLFKYSYIIWNITILLVIASGLNYLRDSVRTFRGKRQII